MKNLHLLVTDKPSRLALRNSGLVYCEFELSKYTIDGQHIYITNDEEIKEGDWVFGMDGIFQYKGKVNLPDVELPKKIILTTDSDLIASGVQAINDEFLEWFVKNPSCEEVEVDKTFVTNSGLGYLEYAVLDSNFKVIKINTKIPQTSYYLDKVTILNTYEYVINYKITIPQEEPKQELNSLVESWQKRQKEYEDLAEQHRDCEHTYKKYTYRAQATRDCWKELLTFNKTTEGYYDDFKMIEGEKIEEAAKRFWKESKANPIEMAIFGAKWQQEQDVNMVQSYLSANLQNIELLEKSYSQEEVDVLIHELINEFTNWSGSFVNRDILIEIHEQLKRK
jgi:hypothetical protein